MSLDPEESKVRRARHRRSSPEVLKGAGIDFETRNDGAHLIVQKNDRIVDFWPGTGLWITRATGERGRGVFPLVKWLNWKPAPCADREPPYHE